MPTFMAFNKGQKVNELVGANPQGLQVCPSVKKGLVGPLEYGERDASVVPDATKLPSTHAAWSLVTEFDPDGHMWTSHGPDAIVARRVTVLARATWEGLCGLESGDGNVKVRPYRNCWGCRR